jgi:hypothetical protein
MTLFDHSSGLGRPAFTAKSELARRFHAAWADSDDPGTAVPELLPVRLTRACVQVLPVVGAGLSLMNASFRVPVGASDEMASVAERLQFTQGEGPCLDAARQSRAVIAGESDIRQQWPMYAAEFFAQTSYRAALCLPLRLSPDTTGALDLFVTDQDDLADISLADAVSIADEIMDALIVADALTSSVGAFSDEVEPAWLHTGSVRNRTNVWVAMGILMTQLGDTADTALALLRGYCFSHDIVLDDLADALVTGRLDVAEI